MVMFAFNRFDLLLRCVEKLVHLIYCFQVLSWMNFKIMYFVHENLWKYPLRRQYSLSSQNAT